MAGLGRENHERRTQPLAPAADDVLGDLADECDIRAQTLPQALIHRRQVVAEQGFEKRDRHEGRLRRGKSGHTGTVGAKIRRRRSILPDGSTLTWWPDGILTGTGQGPKITCFSRPLFDIEPRPDEAERTRAEHPCTR